MSELLAPAGNEECAYAAINAGADAVYLGLTAFSARSSAENFDFPALKKLADYAHFLGVKVHVAMNTLVKEEELQEFLHNAVMAHNAGADALIIQDMYIGAYLKRQCPEICLHLSTQAGVCNAYGARLAASLGFSRVILARETAFEDAVEIAKITETEVFVQGALCTCFSGQCYFSSFAGGNSGNRGRCKQPCRKLYSIDRKGFGEMAYRLSPSDLCVGENILKYRDAGVYSFKIEGRMRRPEYVSAAVRYYRAILDGGREEVGGLSALKRTYNRGNYTKGLAFGQDKNFLSTAVQGHMGEYVGTLSVSDGRYVVSSAEKCGEGDCFKVLRGGKEIAGATYASAAKGGFVINSRTRLKAGDKVFITTDRSLAASLASGKREKGILLEITAEAGKPVTVYADGERYVSSFVVQAALNRPTTHEDVLKCFSKKDSYPFRLDNVRVDVGDGAFIPASLLNEFRRNVYSEIYSKCGGERVIYSADVSLPPHAKRTRNRAVCIAARRLTGLNADIGILRPDDYFADIAPLTQGFSGEKFLYLPPYLRGAEIRRLKQVISAFDGIYCSGNYAAPLAEELGVKYFAGVGANISNSVALGGLNADYVALSKELTYKEAEPLFDGNTFMLTCGDIKLMDLVYCPFGKSCSSCDRRDFYALTDEGGRKFLLRRYSVGECRFEVLNCASLVGENAVTGILCDFTSQIDARAAADCISSVAAQRALFGSYTKGHGETPVL